MHGKFRISFVILACFGLALTLSWKGKAASLPPSLRDNPEFRDMLSGVVVIDPRMTVFPQAPSIPLALDAVLNLLGDVPVGPNVLCNQDPTTQSQNEPSIDVNPSNPNHIVASSNDYRLRINPPPAGDVRAGYYVSFDRGNTWPGDGVIDISSIPNTFAAGDPAIAIHDMNNVYFGYIAFNRDTDNAGGVAVSKSTDGGLTWQPPVVVSWNSNSIFNDKDYIAVDATGSLYDGNVYVTWTRFYDTPIVFSRSTDGGASFSAPLVISDPGSSNQGSIPVVGPNGVLYVAWYNYDQDSIRINKSTNGGASFGTPNLVAYIDSIPYNLPGAGFRDNSFPTMAVDQNNGYVYVAWSNYTIYNDADILFTRSTDGGTTWSAPLRVNDDPVDNDAHQFFPWIDVAPNGKVYIGWFDSRLDPTPLFEPLLYDEYVAVSTDNGLTFSPNQRISEVTADSSVGFSPPFIGDYSGLAATNDFVFPAWVDTRRGQEDIFTQTFINLVGNKLAPSHVERLEPFTYTLSVNTSDTILDNQLVDPLPTDVTYVPGSAWASSGLVDFSNGAITWNGDLSAGIPLTITFNVTPIALECSLITNTAVLTSGLGFNYELSATSIVSGSPPIPAFSWVDAELAFTFTNETSGASPLSFVWNFGDGITSTEISPVHEYAYPGIYTVTLTAANLCGTADTIQVMEATCSAPQAAFNWLGDELTVSFTNTSTGHFSLSYLWNFGDGITSTLASPVHDYGLPGTFDVTLAATDLCGLGTITDQVTTTCTAPMALFAWQVNGISVSFTDQSDGTPPLDYLWDFGDGITSTEQSPTHLYTHPGTYSVHLTVNAPCGVDEYIAVIRVGNFIYIPVTFKH
jgi:PKD repeat protein